MRAVLLDVDGTLLDSNDAQADAFVEAFSECGFDVPWERVRGLIGKGGDKLIPEAGGLPPDDPWVERVKERKKAIFAERYLPAIRAFPGARDLVVRLRDAGFEVVVATSASEEEAQALLAQGGLDDLLPNRTSASDAEESKPDPDIVQGALEKAGCPPEEAILLGDTPYDAEAAARAGVRFVGVRSGGWDLDGYDDVADLLARWDSSPFAS